MSSSYETNAIILYNTDSFFHNRITGNAILINKIKYVSLLSAIALSFPAHATFFMNNIGLSGAFYTENFDSNAGAGTAAGSQFTGITFSTGTYVNNDFNGYPNMTNSVIANWQNGNDIFNEINNISFSVDLTDIAFSFISNPQDTTLNTYLNNILVESVTGWTGYPGGFYGVHNSLFNRLEIVSTNAFIMDNMQAVISTHTNAVPEPATIGLLATGLIGFGASRRKKGAVKNGSLR